MTLQQVAAGIEELVRNPAADLTALARKLTLQLQRNERSRHDRWRFDHGRCAPPRFPPPT